VGDMIRAVSRDIQDPDKKLELELYLEKNYRGWTPPDDLIAAIEGRDTKNAFAHRVDSGAGEARDCQTAAQDVVH